MHGITARRREAERNDMTAKRDLKRRVRQRQARTGESYVTARRRVLAAREARAAGEGAKRDEPTEPEATGEAAEVRETIGGETTERDGQTERTAPPAEPGLPVVELHDLTREAWELGFRCRVTAYPSVVEACEIADVLTALRDALVGAGGDPGRAHMFDVAFGVPSKPAVAVLPEPYIGEPALMFPVAGRSGTIHIRCRLWKLAPSLMLRRADDKEPGLYEELRPVMLERFEREVRAHAMSQFAGELSRAAQRTLFVIHGARRTKITKHVFVIGCDHNVVDLAIFDGAIPRAHAAVVYRQGAYYLKDLGSTSGILFKGMRIDNKRIEEGDVFHIDGHPLRFTFRPG
jgi:hypothetical protein